MKDKEKKMGRGIYFSVREYSNIFTKEFHLKEKIIVHIKNI